MTATQMPLSPTRNWIAIPPYYASQYDQKHRHLTHSWYVMTDDDERVVCIHDPDNGAPWANRVSYGIQRLSAHGEWDSLSPFNIRIHNEEQAFRVAEWRYHRRHDPDFDEPAPWLEWE